MSGKRVLIIAYYFPPLGMGGVQRASKLAKYLPQFGYDVDVITVKPIRYGAYDASLLEELPSDVKVHRAGSSDPARIAHILRLPISPGSSLSGKIKKSGRYWPDTKIGWKKKAVALADQVIADKKIDIIFSTSPPMTSHLVAMELAQKHHIKWVADFRDFWESRPPADIFSDNKVIKKSYGLIDQIHKQADAITRVNDALGSDVSDKPITVQGGFDPDDFRNIESDKQAKQFLITYLGSSGPLCPLDRIIEAVGRLCGVNDGFRNDFKIKIIGQLDTTALEKIAADNNIAGRIVYTGYLSHRYAIKEASPAALSLISLASEYPGILPGKIFDLLPFSAPILAVVPSPGEAAKIITKTDAGLCVAPDDIDKIAEIILYFYQRFKKNETWEKKDISRFSRVDLARQFSEIFNMVLGD